MEDLAVGHQEDALGRGDHPLENGPFQLRAGMRGGDQDPVFRDIPSYRDSCIRAFGELMAEHPFAEDASEKQAQTDEEGAGEEGGNEYRALAMIRPHHEGCKDARRGPEIVQAPVQSRGNAPARQQIVDGPVITGADGFHVDGEKERRPYCRLFMRKRKTGR